MGPTGNKDLLAKVQSVTIDDLQRVLDKYIRVLFQNNSTNLAVAVNPLKLEETVKFFNEVVQKKATGTSLDDLKDLLI